VAEDRAEPEIAEPLAPVEEPGSSSPWPWIWAGILVSGALILWFIKVKVDQ
jgi:hypothetical protein